ncbi:hypothetical protein BE221DRAFT_194555 [Ostreococcus tauri]|uniref:Uncharacterized protein n=1 Tax=Ostreococcus tauri TaxID=70448 RepID=A0A1Y5I5Y0_OSTTA|nr:hypothetical protein BE221DRAFT_194555 [Ostreococcus tauri]
MCVVAALTGAYARARGVEILRELHEAAMVAVERYEAARGEMGDATGDVSVELGDLLECDVSDADVVFVHATCFTPELLGATATKLARELKNGARVALVSKQFPEGWVFAKFDTGYRALAQPQSAWKLDCFLYEIVR